MIDWIGDKCNTIARFFPRFLRAHLKWGSPCVSKRILLVCARLLLLVACGVALASAASDPPLNDPLVNPTEVFLADPVQGTFAGASKQSDEPDILGDWSSGFASHHPVWWLWTATTS